MERTPIKDLNVPVQTSVEVSHVTTHRPTMLNDVPIDILRHFGIDHRDLDNKSKDMMNDIYKWTSEDLEEITTGNITKYIGDVQMRLGGDRSYSRVWNWLRVKSSIRDMEKQQKAMELG